MGAGAETERRQRRITNGGRPALKTWIALFIFFALSFGVALSGALFPPGEWYAGLMKPAWTPPDWLFPPVWTLLYVAMAVAAWLVWKRVGLSAAIGAYLIQLTLNGLWSWLFFGLHRPLYGVIDIALLWLAIVVTVVLFLPASRLGALLMLPYLLWVSFAGALNFAIWQLNR